jgi:L-asparaginase II
MNPVIAEVVRSGFVEGHHYGSVIAIDEDGTTVLALGDVDSPIFPRSSNKPLQAAGMLHTGLQLDDELLALAASSHSGEAFHLDGVRSILASVGLSSNDLQTPPDLPLDEAARTAWLRAGRKHERVAMNCSGKHAAMLAACVVNDWPTETYLEPAHPLQRALRGTIEELSGEKVGSVGVDGCGAPLFALSLSGLARAFRELVFADAMTPEGRVAAAMRAYPRYVGGTGRDVTLLMNGVPGLLVKDGAEGVYAAALPDGRAVALKVDDGAMRARAPVMVAAMRHLGVDAPVLTELQTTTVLGGGRPVGEVRAVLLGNRGTPILGTGGTAAASPPGSP